MLVFWNKRYGRPVFVFLFNVVLADDESDTDDNGHDGDFDIGPSDRKPPKPLPKDDDSSASSSLIVVILLLLLIICIIVALLCCLVSRGQCEQILDNLKHGRAGYIEDIEDEDEHLGGESTVARQEELHIVVGAQNSAEDETVSSCSTNRSEVARFSKSRSSKKKIKKSSSQQSNVSRRSDKRNSQQSNVPRRSDKRKSHNAGNASSDAKGSESHLLGINLKWTLEVFPLDVQEHLEDDRIAEDLSFHEIAPIKAYGDTSYGKGRVCPRDGRMDCSIVDAVVELGHSRRANLFLSWVWNYKLGVVLEALQSFCRQVNKKSFKAETCFVWWCFFQNNQHRMLGEDKRLTTEELAEVFGSRLQEVGAVVCLMDRIEGSEYTQRIWCVYEVFMAQLESVPLEIILPSSCQEELNSLVKEGGFPRLKNAITIDVAQAKASCLEDQENIRDMINTASSFKAVNKTVRQSLARCIQSQILKAITMGSAASIGSEEDSEFDSEDEIQASCDKE